MKEGWTYKTLGEVATFARGLTYSKKDEVESSKNIVLRSNNIDLLSGKLDFSELKYLDENFEIPSDKRVKQGSLFICMSNGSKAHLGKVAYIDKDYNYAFGGFMGQITPTNDVDGLYLHYALSSPLYKDYIKSLSEGANINNLKFKDLSGFVIGYPPLSEQRSIVSRLDAAFAGIDALKVNAERQLAEARALFNRALTEEMTPKEGWEEKTLKEIGLTQTGTTPSKTDPSNYGDYIPFIRPSEIDVDGCGSIEYNSEMKLSEQGLSNGRLFKKHSILMVCIGTVGKVGFCSQDVSCNQQINVLTPNNKYDYKFIYYAMRNADFNDNVIKIAKSAQATLPIINKGKWEKLSLCIPPLTDQQQIVTRLDALSANVRRLEEVQRKTLAECDALKQAMLREVFE